MRRCAWNKKKCDWRSTVHLFFTASATGKHSWEMVRDMMAVFFSFTLDRGPEVGLKKTYTNLDVFPHWRPLRQEEDYLDLSDGNGGEAATDPIISLAHILDIAGVMHQIDNIEKRMLLQIASWTSKKKHFEAAITVFHRPYLRKRFVNTCLVGAEQSLMRHV